MKDEVKLAERQLALLGASMLSSVMVLAAQYESVTSPIAVIMAVPVALSY